VWRYPGDEEVVEELFKFTWNVIYGDNKSCSMAEACAVKWKKMKNMSCIRLPPDGDSLHQHCLLAISSVPPHPETPPSPLGHG